MFSVRDIYPNYSNILSTTEQTVPDREEQAVMNTPDNVDGTSKKVVTSKDIMKTALVFAGIIIVLGMLGITNK